MKTFRDLISEVAQPKSKDEIDFKAKHEIEMIDHPESEEHQHTSEKRGRKRLADYAKGQDMSVYESVKFGGKTFTDYKTFNSDREANRFLEKNDDYGVIGTKGGKVYVAKMDDMGESYELEESFSVFKPMSPAPGRSVSNRVQVKAFKTSDAMNTFLAKGDNALHWKPTDKSGLKSGKYKMDMKRGSDGKPARDFIREGTDDDVEENAFMGKAAAAKKAGKEKFKLGDKNFPVTMKKDTAKEILDDDLDESNTDKYMWKDINAALMKAGVPPTTIMRVVSALKGKELKEDAIDESNKDIDAIMSISKIKRDAQKARHGITRKPRESLAAFIARAEKHKSKMQKEDLNEKEYGPGHIGAIQKMLDKERETKKSKNHKEEVDLTENFKQGSLTLKDGSKVIVSKQNADLLNQMFKDLNAANRREMMNVAMKNKDGFNEILGFAKEAL